MNLKASIKLDEARALVGLTGATARTEERGWGLEAPPVLEILAKTWPEGRVKAGIAVIWLVSR